jgi:aspartyl-tRNA(Asn)/glutamyl-tRNA(Gln) amidotransferase subunit C
MSQINMKKLAALSGLSLSSDEEVLFSRQAEDTLQYIENLSDLNTTNVIPTSSVTGTRNQFRNDTLSVERKQKPSVYKVPRIMS